MRPTTFQPGHQISTDTNPTIEDESTGSNPENSQRRVRPVSSVFQNFQILWRESTINPLNHLFRMAMFSYL